MSIDLKEELDLLAVSRQACVLKFRGSNGGLATIKARISRVSVTEAGYYVQLDNGLQIKGSDIVALNDSGATYC